VVDSFSHGLLSYLWSVSTFIDGKLQKIFERVGEGEKPLMKGTETIFFDDHGTMYATTEQGKLITLTDMATDESTGKTTVKATYIKDLGAGRPLSGKFWGDTLYIADSVLGLTRIQNVSNPHSKVEIVASTVMDQGKETRIRLADDVAIGPQSGKVYFTDGKDPLFQRFISLKSNSDLLFLLVIHSE